MGHPLLEFDHGFLIRQYRSDFILRNTLLTMLRCNTLNAGFLAKASFFKSFLNAGFPGAGDLIPYVTFGSHVVLESDLFLRGKGGDFRGFKQDAEGFSLNPQAWIGVLRSPIFPYTWFESTLAGKSRKDRVC